MPKYIKSSQMLGALGETFIRSAVLKMGHIFECIRHDAGLDGTIELRDPATGEMLNQILRVQVKATSSFRSETTDAFSFTCAADDIAYWLKGNTPNILVVCDPEKGLAYWKSIREYFNSPERRTSRSIRFDKKADVFDKSASGRLFQVARPVDSGLYMEAPNVPEVLSTNLLALRTLPSVVHIAPTECTSLKQVYGRARDEGADLPPEVILLEKTLISVHDFREDPQWRLVCEQAASESFSLDERFNASDEADRRHISEILHKCLRGFGKVVGLRYLRREHLFYMQYVKGDSSAQTRTFKASGRSSSAERIRQLVSPLGGRARGFKHCAFNAEFQFIDGSWYAQLSPTYYYTYDGYHEKRNAAEFLAGIKRLERNKAVFSQLRLWEEFLCDSGNEDLLTGGYPHIAFGPLEFCHIDRSVPDSLWRKEGVVDDHEEGEIL